MFLRVPVSQNRACSCINVRYTACSRGNILTLSVLETVNDVITRWERNTFLEFSCLFSQVREKLVNIIVLWQAVVLQHLAEEPLHHYYIIITS